MTRQAISGFEIEFHIPESPESLERRKRHRAFGTAPDAGLTNRVECESPRLRARFFQQRERSSGRHFAQADDGRVTLLFDGFLVNREELAALISGPPQAQGPAGGAEPSTSASRGEAELLLDLYLGRGDDFLAQANGWFFLLIVDERRRLAVVANDRFGIHPCYYAESEGGLCFAGEARRLPSLAGLQAELDPKGLADYLAFDGVLGDGTLFAGVRRLPPASYWVHDGGEWRRDSYFDFIGLTGKSASSSAKELERKIDAIFARVLPRYYGLSEGMIVSLTGGWDTRVIASFLDRPLPSYTYGMHPRSLDGVLAARVAKKVGLDHRFLCIDGAFFGSFADFAQDALLASDGLGDVCNAHILYILDQLDSAHGYTLTGKYGTQVVRGDYSKAFDLNIVYLFDSLHPDLRETLRQSAVDSQERSRARYAKAGNVEDQGLLFILLEECRKIWGPNLAIERTKVCPTTPFTDNDVIDLLFALPPALRQGSVLQKGVVARNRPDLAVLPTNRGELADGRRMDHRLAAKRYHTLYFLSLVCNSRRLPAGLQADRLPFAKLGTAQYRRWLRRELRGFVEEVLLDERTLGRGIFDREAIRTAVAEHMSRKRDRSNELRKMLSLELSHRLLFDG